MFVIFRVSFYNNKILLFALKCRILYICIVYQTHMDTTVKIEKCYSYWTKYGCCVWEYPRPVNNVYFNFKENQDIDHATFQTKL